MGLKEADESKLLSRLEKLGRDVSALRFQVMLLLMDDGNQIDDVDSWLNEFTVQGRAGKVELRPRRLSWQSGHSGY